MRNTTCYITLMDLLFSGAEKCTVLEDRPNEKYIKGIKQDNTIMVIYRNKVLSKRSTGIPFLLTDDLELARNKLMVAVN